MERITRVIGGNVIRIYPRQKRLISRLANGGNVRAVPHPTKEYLDHALRHGYEWADDPRWQMCFEHEIMHTLYGVELGYAESPTMRDVASRRAREHVGEGNVPWYQWLEEGAVLDLQLYLNSGDIGRSENWGRIFELSWEMDLPAFRLKALPFLRSNAPCLEWDA